MRSTVTCLWKEPGVPKEYRSAVSLHGHTNHSREGLKFIGEFADRNPLLRFAMDTQRKDAWKKSAIVVDFKRSYWRPPLPPLAALKLERGQIERDLGLASMVSLTDHDNIEAPMLLRVVPEASGIPISVEWTVPYYNTIFHVGVHNLPGDRAEAVMAHFAEYTNNPVEGHLADLFKMLHEDPNVLVVLNHPMWDLAGTGKQRHVYLLSDFAAKLGMYVHALELGGFRTWEENQAVLAFAEKWNQIVIGGGDRHGAEPSAVLNLTNAETFPEFVHEVRQKKRCHVLFMPQYAEPVPLRMLGSVLDAIRYYSDYPNGARHWDERVFHPDRNGVIRPLRTLWDAPPFFIPMFFATVRLLEIEPIRRAMQASLAKTADEKEFALRRGQEAATQWKRAYGSRSFQTRTTKSTVWQTRAGNLRRSREGAD